ncbi:efflux RND transporter periplasmic adaptor subunit [Oceanicola sp. D3]|uniref:efflux RND transporter periplasmic adaptor subunit n=1 Tax=Oceanicola sp. D3 TaxID=2587163 RepID=UPI0011243492|nr:efflux RND transporter periplasmic adaptor subunit [Oceanicola sp. D3]QDC10755.1 efflux RND transporter periplasmic adaptor subunit [Oceanicola sp. D3]
MSLPAVLVAALLVIGLAPISPALAQPVPGGARGPAEVGVVELELSTVPFSVTLPGRAVAAAQTDIRPRVGGMVKEIVYRPGQRVKAGDVLYRLEPDTFEAAYAAAQAELAGAKAGVSTAQATVDRYARLEGTGVTTSDLQTAQSALAQAEAALASAEAAVQTARLDLDRVEIRSPIDGFADVSTVSVGAIVTANQTDALTTVTAMDPINVDVSESSARILRVRSQIDSGALQRGERLEAVLTLENGETYASPGTLVTPGQQVSTTTGSVDLRFEFGNPNRMILPGQFLRVAVVVGQQKAVLVPQRGTERQADGTLTAFILRDGKAHQVTLTYSGTHENAWITTEGVAAGDLLIVDGLNNLTDGAEVVPVPVTINAQGVVEDVTDDAADEVDTTDEADTADEAGATEATGTED